MSRVRSKRKERLRKRATIVKGVTCKYCSNEKFHYDGGRAWCTKCKHDTDDLRAIQRTKILNNNMYHGFKKQPGFVE